MVITDDFNKFSPRDYLKEIHSDNGTGEANKDILLSLIDEYKLVKPNSILLELGGGPAIYQLITAATKVKSIYFSEYIKGNLEEIKLWLKNDSSAWNWDGFINTTLSLEGSKDSLEKRKKLIRKKIVEILPGNVKEFNPVYNDKYLGFFDVIALNFVLDSITNSLKDWEKYLDNCLNLLKPKGVLIYNAIADIDTGWETGGIDFVGVEVRPNMLKEIFEKRSFKIKYLKKKSNSECRGHSAHLFCVAVRN